MRFFRARTTGKVEWSKSFDQAQSIALEWAKTICLNKDSGEVTVDAITVTYRNYDHLLAVLNGLIPMRRWFLIVIEKGVVIAEHKWTRYRHLAKTDPIDMVAHPTHRHADWIKTVHSINEYQKIYRMAPDPKVAFIACKLAKIDTSIQGHKLTTSINRYCWDWINSTAGR